MKKILYVSLGALLGLILGLVYNSRKTETPKVIEEKASSPMSAKRVLPPPASSVPKLTDLELKNDARAKERPSTGMTLVLSTHETPVDYAVVQIAYKHPELHLKPEEAADLQEIFAANYKLFAGFQAKVAWATTLSDGSTQIQIPAFPTQGQQLVDGLVSAVQSYYNGNVPAGVMEAIVEGYRGFTNSAGQVPVTLTVTVSEDPNFSYSVTRRMVFLDPVTGQVTGVGESKDAISKNQELYSPYSEFKSMFPRPRG